MVVSISSMKYTSDWYDLQCFYCCINLNLCPCIVYLYRLTSIAVCNQISKQFCIQLPRSEAAKPKLMLLFHPIGLLKNNAKHLHQLHELCIIAVISKKPHCTLIHQGIIYNNDPMPYGCTFCS